MKKLNLIVLALTGLIFVSCQNEDIKQTNEQPQEVSNDALSKLEKLGFDTTIIPVQKLKNGFRVEGDIFVSNKLLDNPQSYQSKQKYKRGALVSCNRARSIKILNRLPKNSPAGKAVPGAIKRWNDIQGSILKFQLVSQGSRYDILIRDDNRDDQLSDNGQMGTTGDFPQNGRPTQFVAINRNVRLQINGGASPNRAQWTNLMTHELGHGIGLYHNEETRFGVRTVPGTPNNDRQSIMTTSGRNFLPLPGLSTNDRKAIRRIYGTNGNRLCR